MAIKTPEDIERMLLEMESEVDDSKVASKKGKLKGAPANIAGKIYRDIFGIRREGNIYTNPNAIIVDTLKKGQHDDWNLIPIGTRQKKLTEIRQFIRRAKIRIEFQCCYNGNPQNDPIQMDIELEDIYDNRDEAYKISNLHNWINYAFRESTSNISEEECDDWNEQYEPCEKTRKLLEILRKATESYEGIDDEYIKEQIRKYEEQRQQELLKAQQKKEKADKKKKAKLEKERKKAEKRPKPEEREVPVVIDEEPIIITFKKELTTTDVIQISRAAKSISKLEKQKEEQTKFLNVALGAIERIEESEKLEFLLSQIVTRDRWLDSINITNTLIERQKEIIEHLKRSTK